MTYPGSPGARPRTDDAATGGDADVVFDGRAHERWADIRPPRHGAAGPSDGTGDGSSYEGYGHADHAGQDHAGQDHAGQDHAAEYDDEAGLAAEDPGDLRYADARDEPEYTDGVFDEAAGAEGPDDQPDYMDEVDPHPFLTEPTESQLRADRAAERAVRARRRRRRLRGLTLLVAACAVGAAGWFAWQGLRPVLAGIGGLEIAGAGADDYPGPGTGSVEVVITPGESGGEMAASLVEADVVASERAFLSAANIEPEFTSIQPGTYTLLREMRAFDAVQALLDPANRSSDAVVLPEGLRVDQVLDGLADGTGIPRTELEAALAEAPLPAAAQGNPEGFLYPGSYEFGPDVTAQEVVAQLLERNQAVLTELGVPPEQQLTVLTKASLIQGEARLAEDFSRVARVVENRLAVGQPLQLDSTVNYATQTFDTRTTAQQREVDSPYNTYRYAGLPPGPIKSPGRQAIDAALAPAEGPWLYFVTVDLDTGETLFTADYEEHLRNVEQLNQWQRTNGNDPNGADANGAGTQG